MSRKKGQTYKPKALTREQIAGIINHLTNLRDKALVALIFLTGSRKSEILGVKKSDFRYEKDFLIVKLPILKRGKDLTKIIPIPLIDPFTKYITQYLNKIEGKLFDITPQRVWQILIDVGVRPHELRHSRLTEIATYMPSDVEIYRFAGWKLPGMEDTYLHLRYEQLKEPLRKISEKVIK